MRRWWRRPGGAGGELLSTLAIPAEAVYRAAVRLRNESYDRGIRRTHEAAVPVISVGNLSVGGTGKTPVAGWMVGLLREAGHRPSLVARGYGEDEIRLHQRWNPGVPVFADPDRVAGVALAVAEGAKCVVLDDGFQHRRLARDLDIVLLAAEQPFPAPLLPRGPYREPPGSLTRADVVLVTRKAASELQVEAMIEAVERFHPEADLARVDLVAGGWQDVHGGLAEPPSAMGLALSSVGEPDTFVQLLRMRLGRTLDLLTFPDHHDYQDHDIRRIAEAAEGRDVITTEKDAVKLAPFEDRLPPLRVLPLMVEPRRGADVLRAVLLSAARKDPPPAGRSQADRR